jgi:hypothetical protein
MKPSMFRPSPRTSPKVAPAPAPAPTSTITSTRGNPLRGGSSRRSFKEGGATKEPKAMMKKEVSFMKKKGAPKSMIKHEMAEAGMKHGGKVKKMAGGGLAAGHKQADGIARKGKTDTKRVVMKSGGAVKKLAKGGRYC